MQISTALHRIRFGGLCLVLVALPAAAQQVRFNPRISVEQSYTDNVGYVDPEAGADTSDTSTRLAVELPVEREWPTGSLRFSYRPSYEKYGDRGDLDHDSHLLRFDLDSTPSRGAALALRTSFERTQFQGNAASRDDADLFLAQRTDRDLARAELTYGRPLSERWSWSGALGVADSSFDVIASDELPAVDALPIEDRTSYNGSLGFSTNVSRTTNVGISYGALRTDLEISPSETTHSLSVTAEHRPARKLVLRASVGGYTTDRDEGSDSGAQARLGLDREFRRLRLGLNVEHAPSSGGAQRGTSTNSAVGLTLTGDLVRRWFWGASARYARRDPNPADDPTLDTYSVGGRLERSFLRVLGVSVGADYVTQSSSDGIDEGSFYTATAGIVYYPLGRMQRGK